MARIRTIKPEFWSDDAVTECSLTARLLFIGIWNFADDYGVIERSSKQMKMKIFPADNIETEPLVLELIAHDLLVEFEARNCKYLFIKGFAKHQVINKPSKTRHPDYHETTANIPPLPEHYGSSDCGKGREGKGRELGKEKDLKQAAVEICKDNPAAPPPAAGGQAGNLPVVVPLVERQIRQAIDEKRLLIKEKYPWVDIEVEILEMIAKYQGQSLGVDPWVLISRWLKNLKKPLARGRDSPASLEQQAEEIREHNRQVCREFANAQ